MFSVEKYMYFSFLTMEAAASSNKDLQCYVIYWIMETDKMDNGDRQDGLWRQTRWITETDKMDYGDRQGGSRRQTRWITETDKMDEMKNREMTDKYLNKWT